MKSKENKVLLNLITSFFITMPFILFVGKLLKEWTSNFYIYGSAVIVLLVINIVVHGMVFRKKFPNSKSNLASKAFLGETSLRGIGALSKATNIRNKDIEKEDY